VWRTRRKRSIAPRKTMLRMYTTPVTASREREFIDFKTSMITDEDPLRGLLPPPPRQSRALHQPPQVN